MEKAFIVSEEVKFELSDESDETEDPLTNENTIDTSANANMGTPTIRQVCSWITDGTAENMRVEEIEIEEIKLESTDEFDPSLHLSSKQPVQLVTEKADESGQLVASMSRTSSANEHQYRRLRCNYCSLLFYNEKTLTNHQMKCQQVFEKVNSTRAEPEHRIQISNLEDLQKRLPRFTVTIIKDDGVDTRKRPGEVTPTAQPHNRIAVCTKPYATNIVSVSKLEAQPSPGIATPINLDPLSVETAPLTPSLNAVPSGSIPSVSVPLSILCPPPSVQPDVTAKLADQLTRIENEMAKLRKENCRLRETLDMSIDLPTAEKRSGLTAFEFEELHTREQLEEFEEKLGKDAAFADAMVARLKKENGNCNVQTSIVRSIDALLSRQLFANCSWTGVGKRAPKIAFC